MADHHWHRLTPLGGCKQLWSWEEPSFKENMRRGTLAPPRAGLSGLLSSTLFLCTQGHTASFPWSYNLASAAVVLWDRWECSRQDSPSWLWLPVWLFHPSEGEWGSGYLNLQWKEGCLRMELEGVRYRQQLRAGISSYLHENGIHFNPSPQEAIPERNLVWTGISVISHLCNLEQCFLFDDTIMKIPNRGWRRAY